MSKDDDELGLSAIAEDLAQFINGQSAGDETYEATSKGGRLFVTLVGQLGWRRELVMDVRDKT